MQARVLLEVFEVMVNSWAGLLILFWNTGDFARDLC